MTKRRLRLDPSFAADVVVDRSFLCITRFLAARPLSVFVREPEGFRGQISLLVVILNVSWELRRQRSCCLRRGCFLAAH